MSVLFTRRGQAPVVTNIDPIFANNSWQTIIEACQSNSVPDTWNVADSKPMTVNSEDYTIDIIGKNHDVYSDGSGNAPLTFQFHELYGTPFPMNSATDEYPDGHNIGGWNNCEMRNIHLPSVKALMPDFIQNAIRKVNKLTSSGNKLTTIDTAADELFLLSEVEVFGTANQSVAGEGYQYEYYYAGNSVDKIYKSEGVWWQKLRSPLRNNTTYFVTAENGRPINQVAAATKFTSTAPAFCF